MKKAALHNLGCKVNFYETEAMGQLLEEAGYKLVPFEPGADVYLINTCSVTNIADHKSRQMLHKAKKMNPNAVVIAAGCYVQAATEKLKTDPAVDLMIGNNWKKELVPILEKYLEKRGDSTQNRLYATDMADVREYENLSIKKVEDHTRAFIKIQDGCNQFCSYCVIPYTRGRVRSRRPAEILREASLLVEKGYQEIVLTGIHLSSYGRDFPSGEREGLLGLITRLDQIPGLKRMRLGSLEPRIITEPFAEALAGLKTICPHFHLSLQSGCDATLKRMNRHYTTAQYEEGCRLLRACFDRPAITTDVIVGFPQETEEEFKETADFLEKLHLYELHVFKYSRRAGTAAAAMEGQLTESQKGARSDMLLDLSRRMSLEYRKGFLGERKEVLMEEKITADGVDYLVGHTREYVKAAVKWQEGVRGKLVTGRLDAMLNEEILLAAALADCVN